jgi:hypothetical protein
VRAADAPTGDGASEEADVTGEPAAGEAAAVVGAAGLGAARLLPAGRCDGDPAAGDDSASPARTDAAPRTDRRGPSIRTAVLNTLLEPFSYPSR